MTGSLAFEFLGNVMKRHFRKEYRALCKKGSLRYELTCMTELCAPLPDGLEENDHFLTEEVILFLNNYLGDCLVGLNRSGKPAVR